MQLINHDDFVSITIITLWRLAYTRICLNSLIKKDVHKNFELIIVDNNSQGETVEYLIQQRKCCNFLTLILNNVNLEKTGAMNRGFRIASDQYFLTTDNDVYYRDNWLKILLNVYKSNPGVGAIGTTNPSAQADQKRFHEVNDFLLEVKKSGYIGQSIFFSRDVLEKIVGGYIIPPNFYRGSDGLFSQQVLNIGLSLARFKHYLNYNIDQPDHPLCQRYGDLWEKTRQCWKIGKGIEDVERKRKNELKMYEEILWYNTLSGLEN